MKGINSLFEKMKRIILFIMLHTFAFVCSAQSGVWKTIHQGNKAFHERKYESAVGFYNKILKQNGSYTRAIYNMANAKLAQGQDSTAATLFSKVASSDPTAAIRSQANHNHGYIYQREALVERDVNRKMQLLQKAISCYKQALRDTPSLQPSRYNLALCQKQLKNMNKNSSQQPKPQSHENKPKPQQSNDANNSLTNFARQAENQTRRKMNANKPQRSLGKNW